MLLCIFFLLLLYDKNKNPQFIHLFNLFIILFLSTTLIYFFICHSVTYIYTINKLISSLFQTINKLISSFFPTFFPISLSLAKNINHLLLLFLSPTLISLHTNITPQFLFEHYQISYHPSPVLNNPTITLSLLPVLSLYPLSNDNSHYYYYYHYHYYDYYYYVHHSIPTTIITLYYSTHPTSHPYMSQTYLLETTTPGSYRSTITNNSISSPLYNMSTSKMASLFSLLFPSSYVRVVYYKTIVLPYYLIPLHPHSLPYNSITIYPLLTLLSRSSLSPSLSPSFLPQDSLSLYYSMTTISSYYSYLDLPFLSSPTIYYSHLHFDQQIKFHLLSLVVLLFPAFLNPHFLTIQQHSHLPFLHFSSPTHLFTSDLPVFDSHFIQLFSFQIKSYYQLYKLLTLSKHSKITNKKISMQNNQTTISFLKQNGISALSFSKNGAYCAIAVKKNVSVLIYEIKTFNDINSWKLLQQITEHHQTVSDIDWSVDQKILTVSHDRSVFVWRKNNQKWEKMFVNIDVRLSAMACKWALSCKKFAIAALPTSLIIGYYSPEVKGWTAIVKDKIVSNPIVSLDFHPSGNIVVLGVVDGSIKIVSCSFKKNTDSQIQQLKIDDFPYSGAFEKVDTFGEVLYSIQNILPNMRVWINYVSFENNGKNLLVVTHSSHVKWYEVVEKEEMLINQRDISHKGVPFANGLFNSQRQEIVLGGYDRRVSVFWQQGNNYKFATHLQVNELSNSSRSKGVVTSMLKGIEKKEFSLGEHPRGEEHLNTVKVMRTRGSYVSYDVNGVVHFWK